MFISLSDLRRAFPEDFLNQIKTLTDSYEEAVVETEKFRDKTWSEIPVELLEDSFEIVYWFSPSAFYYYFPSILYWSQLHLDKLGLLIDATLSMLSMNGEQRELKWLRERWCKFNTDQWKVIQNWVAWLDQHDDCDEFEPELGDAKEALDSGFWRE